MLSPIKTVEKVLHVTPHLGGGVGRCIFHLIAHADSSLVHEVLLLEPPVRTETVDAIRHLRVKVTVWDRERNTAIDFVKSCDISVIHWWSHPSLSEWIGHTRLVEGSLIVWSHVSGMSTPLIPESIMVGPTSIVASSSCSSYSPDAGRWFGAVVHSGSIELQPSDQGFHSRGRKGAIFVGHLDYCKLHDDFVEVIAKVSAAVEEVLIVGDGPHRIQIEHELNKLKLSRQPKFIGWVNEPLELMKRFKYFVYPLRPNHYGTGENVLIEALACGLLPLVQGNHAEMAILRSTCSDWRPCSDPDDYVKRISDTKGSDDSQQLMKTIAETSRTVFSARQMALSMNKIILENLGRTTKAELFPRFTGDLDLFLQTQEVAALYGDFFEETIDFEKVNASRWILRSKSKGSVYQYRDWFAGSESFGRIASNLERNLARFNL